MPNRVAMFQEEFVQLKSFKTMSGFAQSFASFCIPLDCCMPVNVNPTHQDSISSTCPLRAALKGLDHKARKCGIVMHCRVFQRCLDSFCKNNKLVSWSENSLMRISEPEKHDLPHILKWLHLTALVNSPLNSDYQESSKHGWYSNFTIQKI